MSTHDLLQSIAQLAAASGILLGVLTLVLGLRRQRTEFEDAITRDYRGIVKPRLIGLMLATEPPAPDTLEAILPDIYAYLDLCNEQVFLRITGRVGRRTWEQWSIGIRGNLARHGFAEGWQRVHQRVSADFEELQLLIDSDFQDPHEWISLAETAPTRRHCPPGPGQSNPT